MFVKFLSLSVATAMDVCTNTFPFKFPLILVLLMYIHTYVHTQGTYLYTLYHGTVNEKYEMYTRTYICMIVYTLYYVIENVKNKRKTQQEELLPLQIYFTLKSLLSVEIQIVDVLVVFILFNLLKYCFSCKFYCLLLFCFNQFLLFIFLFIPSLIHFLVGKC